MKRFVVDPRGPSLYVFGGTSDGMNTQPGLFALDMRAASLDSTAPASRRSARATSASTTPRPAR